MESGVSLAIVLDSKSIWFICTNRILMIRIVRWWRHFTMGFYNTRPPIEHVQVET